MRGHTFQLGCINTPCSCSRPTSQHVMQINNNTYTTNLHPMRMPFFSNRYLSFPWGGANSKVIIPTQHGRFSEGSQEKWGDHACAKQRKRLNILHSMVCLVFIDFRICFEHGTIWCARDSYGLSCSLPAHFFDSIKTDFLGFKASWNIEKRYGILCRVMNKRESLMFWSGSLKSVDRRSQKCKFEVVVGWNGLR